nr:MAG: replication associated protein [Virus sp.]
MVTHFIATAPRTHGWKKIWKITLETWDIHDWIIGMEKGKKGYEHIQIRGSVSGSYQDFFEWHTRHDTKWHIEPSNTGPFESSYERKEGHYWSSYDTVEVRKVRFGNPNTRQKHILRWLESQSDREIDVWLDPSGNHGKSWLTVHLWETGKALVIPRSASTPERLSAFVCSAWKGERIIIIDIPRAQKIDPKLYETIEELKDGLVFDHRYYGKTRNVRGTKILIFTNTPLDTKKLSKDRWRLHGM